MVAGDIILMVVVFALSISVHESAHALWAEKCGDLTARRLGRVSLNPIVHMDMMGTVIIPGFLILSGAPILFGWAKPVPVNPSNLRNPRKDRAKVAAAGPVSNFILAGISMVLFIGLYPWLATGVLPFAEPLYKLLMFNTMINVLLGVFNLIPIPPLDGGGILEFFLSRDAVVWMRKNQMVLIIVLIVFIALGWLRPILNLAFGIVNGIQNFLINLIWM